MQPHRVCRGSQGVRVESPGLDGRARLQDQQVRSIRPTYDSERTLTIKRRQGPPPSRRALRRDVRSQQHIAGAVVAQYVTHSRDAVDHSSCFDRQCSQVGGRGLVKHDSDEDKPVLGFDERSFVIVTVRRLISTSACEN